MLVIAALTSHARLTRDQQHLPFLKDQVDSLSAEIDASPYGLLDDYPNECYPGDVLTAIAMIHRAEKVLGTDHSAFIKRALRGFQGGILDTRGLVPYAANSRRGSPLGPSRGCGNSYVSLLAPELWPEQAREWYELHVRYFWQETWCAAGFREFPKDMTYGDWYMDVDSGPVMAGFGCAASAFGLGAARVNGYFEHAYPLTAEMLVTSWPLPNGTLLLPRLLSNTIDAPCLGEAAILFNLTRNPVEGIPIRTGGEIPAFVFICLALQFAAGLIFLVTPIRFFKRCLKHRESFIPFAPRIQFGLWIFLFTSAAICLFSARVTLAVLLLLCTQFLPRYKRRKTA